MCESAHQCLQTHTQTCIEVTAYVQPILTSEPRMTAKISRRHNTALRPGNVGNRHAGGKKEEEQDACGVDYGGGESHVSGSI